MKRSIFRLLTLLMITGTLSAQSGVGGGGQSNVSGGQLVQTFAGVPTGTCGANALAVNTTNGNLYSCNGGVWTLVGGGGGSSAFSALTSGTNTTAAMVVGTGASLASTGTGTIHASSVGAVFSVLDYGWVDDDSTDNCGTPVTNFLAAVNAYAGPGIPQVLIPMGAAQKAYKLATAGCNLEFDIPVVVHIWGNLDCAQPATTTNCIQLGPTGLVALTAAQTPKYTIDGGGTFTGGATLSNGGIECEPFLSNCVIDGLSWKNFGAASATDTCANYAILFDTSVAEGTVSHNQWAKTDAAVGRCAFGNPTGASTGQNTISFVSNIFGGQGPLGGCSGTAINDGGSYGKMIDNNIFGFRMDARISGIGHTITDNQFDSSGCATVTGSVNAAIQFGATGSSASVGTINISNNIAEFGSGHLTNLFQKAGDSTAPTLKGVTIVGNQAPQVLSLTVGSILPASPTTNCTGNTTTFSNCYIYGNPSMSVPSPCGLFFVGWQIGNNLASCTNNAQVANLGSTLLFTPGVIQNTLITCAVNQTTAATTSSTLPQCVIGWTDQRTGVVQSVTGTTAWASGASGCSGTVTNTVGNSCQGTVVVLPNQATNVNYSTINYASVGGTAMQYTVYVNAALVTQP
jgi:hypothetical protein